jgi:hypothetical protein
MKSPKRNTSGVDTTVKEPTVACLICRKLITAPYGRWSDGWTCSRHCEQDKEKKRARFVS